MKRDFLKKLGIEDEQIEKIMSEHGESVNSLKSEKETLEADKQTLETDVKGLKEQISDRDKQLNKLKNDTTDVEGLKNQIEILENENKDKARTHSENLAKQAKDYEVMLNLEHAKARDNKSVMAHIDMEAVTLDTEQPEGKRLKGFWEQVEDLKESYDYLFIPDDDSSGPSGDKGNPDAKPEDKKGDDYDGGNPNKKGNGGRKVTDEELGKSLAAQIYGTEE